LNPCPTLMDQNFAPPRQRRERGVMAAYLLGAGPMPAPLPQEIAVARLMHGLDHPDIDPGFGARGDAMGHNGMSVFTHCVGWYKYWFATDPQVTVRVPIGHKLTRDIKFPVTIPHCDFLDRICAAMDISPNTARLGWKSNDDPKRSPAHQLLTEDEMRDAFQKFVNIMRNPRRYKEVVMEVINLVSSSVSFIIIPLKRMLTGFPSRPKSK
jgi:hypothetical protein